jgi:4-hydroxy-4-methyl-2-oxoglutarate aldolase
VNNLTQPPDQVSVEHVRRTLHSAIVADAPDSVGYPHQSPHVPLVSQTGREKLVGRCRTMLWGETLHPDPQPNELELKAVDVCKPDDVLIATARGSVGSGIWGELPSTAAQRWLRRRDR